MFYCPGKQYVVTMYSISQRIKIYCRLPALSIYCTLLPRRHTLILANNTFYYWTLAHARCNQIYFLSTMSARWHMNRYKSRYRRENSALYLMWWYSCGTVCLRRRWYLCLLCLGKTPDLHLVSDIFAEIWELMPRIWCHRASHSTWSFSYLTEKDEKKKITQQLWAALEWQSQSAE